MAKVATGSIEVRVKKHLCFFTLTSMLPAKKLKYKAERKINFFPLFDASPTPERETLADFDVFDEDFLVVTD